MYSRMSARPVSYMATPHRCEQCHDRQFLTTLDGMERHPGYVVLGTGMAGESRVSVRHDLNRAEKLGVRSKILGLQFSCTVHGTCTVHGPYGQCLPSVQVDGQPD